MTVTVCHSTERNMQETAGQDFPEDGAEECRNVSGLQLKGD